MQTVHTLSQRSFIANYFIEDISQHLTLKKGEIIYSEINKPFGVYFLQKGKVKICKMGIDGKEFTIRIATEGEFLNLADVLSQDNYTTYALVLEDTTALFIPKKELMALLVQQQRLFEQFLILISTDIKLAQQKLTDMAYKPVRGRLAQAIVFLAGKFKECSDEFPSLHITQYDLACYVGTARGTVNRLISEFRNDGLIATNGTNISILNPDKLYRISQLYN